MTGFVKSSPEYLAKIADGYLYCVLDEITEKSGKISNSLITKIESINETLAQINEVIIRSGIEITTRPALELITIHQYWVVVRRTPISEFTKNDIKFLENLKAEISEKICAKRRDELLKIALCDDPMTATPHPSICGRCGVISPAPDGSGYMCGLNLRALEEFGFNSDYLNTLARQKINPHSERSRTYTAGGTDHE